MLSEWFRVLPVRHPRQAAESQEEGINSLYTPNYISLNLQHNYLRCYKNCLQQGTIISFTMWVSGKLMTLANYCIVSGHYACNHMTII